MTVDKFDFLVFEKNPDIYDAIRKAIVAYSIKNNVESDIFWLSQESQLSELATIARTVHVAFINADYETYSLMAGKAVFKEDEDVLIVFYGKNSLSLKPYFKARPIAYLDFEEESFESLMDEMYAVLNERKKVFTWTNKNVRIFIPYSRIIYMQSYKGYVDIFTTDSKQYHILGKLDAAEEKLCDERFLRIHKSTIVNLNHIRSMDRTNKCCIMSNDDKVYISKAYYKTVSSTLCE